MTDHSAVSVDDEILSLEKKRTEALLARDFTTLDYLFESDLLYVHSNGKVETKAEFLDAMRTGKANYRAFEFRNVAVRGYGDSAIVTGEVVMTANNRRELRFTNVWSKASGRWRNVHWASAQLKLLA
jgi:ketosteroid isomerase-like protein